MAIHKLKQHQNEIPYFMVSREAVQSLKNPDALAIWAYLQSQSDDWSVVEKNIREHFNLGRSRYLSAMKELREAGLYEVIRHKDENNNFTGSHFHIYASPQVRNSTLMENDTYIKEKEITKEKENNKKKESYPAFVKDEFDKKIFDYRKSIKKPLKTERGLSNLRKNIALAAKAWRVTEFQVLGVIIDNEWQSINPNWNNPFSDKVVSISQAVQQKQSSIPTGIKLLNPEALSR